MKNLIYFMMFLVSLSCFGEPFTITYRAPESEFDTRFDYPLELITMAMNKTKSEYGDYILSPAPNMNFLRASSESFIATLDNFIFETSVTLENEKNLLSVPIPIAKGLYGFRLFLINKDNQALFDKVKTLDDLKKFSIGQGAGWADIDILEKEKFKVIQGTKYEGLFQMLIAGRFDAFSRGVNEAFAERDARINKLPKLAVEKNICLYYPLPRYFYTAKKNTLLAERMTKGLELMIEDGSFDDLWLRYHQNFLDEGNLANRKIFKINNSFLPSNVPLDNPKYWYFPK